MEISTSGRNCRKLTLMIVPSWSLASAVKGTDEPAVKVWPLVGLVSWTKGGNSSLTVIETGGAEVLIRPRLSHALAKI